MYTKSTYTAGQTQNVNRTSHEEANWPDLLWFETAEDSAEQD